MRARVLCLSAGLLLLAACGGDPPGWDKVWESSLSRVSVAEYVNYSPTGQHEKHNRPYLKDRLGRYVHFHGINLSCSTKFPATEKFDPGNHVLEVGEEVSYIGKPFPEKDADLHFGKLQEMGINSVRLLVNWEGIQHAGPWTVDTEYLDYIARLVDTAGEYGIYVLLDMHQDMFSRHLFVRYNKDPIGPDGKPYPRGSLEAMAFSLIPPYNDWNRGDGAPKWVVQTILQEKDLDSPWWGYPRILGQAVKNPGVIFTLLDLLESFGDGEGMAVDANKILQDVVTGLPENAATDMFHMTKTSDMMPWTMWGVNTVTSLDVQRCFASFFAGHKIYPDRRIEGMNLTDYLQENYKLAFVELAKRVKDKPNVIGYDIMNEPMTFFIVMAAVAAFLETGAVETVDAVVKSIAGEELGGRIFEILVGLSILPPVPKDEEDKAQIIKDWGFEGADLMAMVEINLGFDRDYLQPLHERVGKAIQQEDPEAIIWFESGMGLGTFLGESPQWNMYMTRPEGIKQAVFAPHWYPDIYPFIGINQPPREFGTEQWKYQDFTDELEAILHKVELSMSNVPVVLGEFGTYYNFNGIEKSIKDDYRISSQILDNYYRALEKLNMSHMQWCYSPENDHEYGDGWDLEDFSVIDPDWNPRGHYAFVRPFARATSGRKLESRFHSPYEYIEPEKGKPVPTSRFTLQMASKETNAATEIFVPRLQYPDGFYVWVSDGVCYYDDSRQLLLWYPSADDPEALHDLRLISPLIGADVHDWDYFFKGDKVLDKAEVGK